MWLGGYYLSFIALQYGETLLPFFNPALVSAVSFLNCSTDYDCVLVLICGI